MSTSLDSYIRDRDRPGRSSWPGQTYHKSGRPGDPERDPLLPGGETPQRNQSCLSPETSRCRTSPDPMPMWRDGGTLWSRTAMNPRPCTSPYRWGTVSSGSSSRRRDRKTSGHRRPSRDSSSGPSLFLLVCALMPLLNHVTTKVKYAPSTLPLRRVSDEAP